MKLKSYLKGSGVTPAQFAADLKISLAGLYRYMSGERMPKRAIMIQIVELTDGHVQPNDFFGSVSNPVADQPSQAAFPPKQGVSIISARDVQSRSHAAETIEQSAGLSEQAA